MISITRYHSDTGMIPYVTRHETVHHIIPYYLGITCIIPWYDSCYDMIYHISYTHIRTSTFGTGIHTFEVPDGTFGIFQYYLGSMIGKHITGTLGTYI